MKQHAISTSDPPQGALERAIRAPVRPAFRAFRPLRTELSRVHQRSSRHPQVRQREQRAQLRGVLRQSTVAHLRVTELPPHHAEGVLAFGPHVRLEPLDLIQDPMVFSRAQPLTFARPHGHVPHHTLLHVLRALGHTLVARITEDHLFLAVQQLPRYRHVGHVRRRAFLGMHQSGLGVRAHMCLHPEVPLLAHSGLVHFRVACAAVVSGRARCGNNGGIDDRALLEHQALAHEQRVDRLEDPIGERMLLEQIAKVEDRGLVRDRAPSKREIGEATHRGDFVERIFHREVRQCVPLLHEVDAQHRTKRVRMAAFARTGIVRLEHRLKRRPVDHLFHLVEEDLAARFLALGVVFRIGETQLVGHWQAAQITVPKVAHEAAGLAACSEIP